MFSAVLLCLWHEVQSELQVKAHGFVACYKRALNFPLSISCRHQTIRSCCLSNTRCPLRGIKTICFHGLAANTKTQFDCILECSSHPCNLLSTITFIFMVWSEGNFFWNPVNELCVYLPSDSLKTQKS